MFSANLANTHELRGLLSLFFLSKILELYLLFIVAQGLSNGDGPRHTFGVISRVLRVSLFPNFQLPRKREIFKKIPGVPKILGIPGIREIDWFAFFSGFQHFRFHF